jgi:hypothetical protein
MKPAWAVLLCAAVAGPAAAQPPMRLAFDYAGSLNALHLTGEVKVLSLHVEETARAGDFATRAEMHSFGLLRALRPIDITTAATGPVAQGLPQPHAFAFSTLDHKRLRRVTLVWQRGGVLVTPPHHDDGDPPLTPAAELSASDPVTLFSRAVYAPSGAALCARNWRFFDGAVVYELQFQPGAPTPLTPDDRAMGLVGAVRCQVRYTEVAGFRHKPGESHDEGLKSDIHVQFGQLGAGGPWIFVSMKADTFLGYAKVQLTGVRLERP